MENPEEIMHSLEEFSKMKPKDIPRELEEYLCFVAKTGDPVYQWSLIKCLFREKLIKVITEFYESCHGVDDIPPCPNVEMFNYDVMKNFILEKLDTFIAAPFTVQRICELLTTPRKEYNRIDKYMRALEKNILVVSTMEPGGRRGTENGEGIVNGVESEHSEHIPEAGSEINVEEMDDFPSWSRNTQSIHISCENKNGTENAGQVEIQNNSFEALKIIPSTSSTQETVISCSMYEERLISIEPVTSHSDESKTIKNEKKEEPKNVKEVTITAVHLQSDTEIVSVPTEISPEETSQKDETENTVENKSVVQNDSAVLLSEETPIVSEEKIEESKEITQENKNDENKSESVSIASESGIENISPETSTSSPENLEVSNAEKSEATVKLEDKTKENVEDNLENEGTDDITKTAENIQETDDKTPKSLPHSSEQTQEEKSFISKVEDVVEATPEAAVTPELQLEQKSDKPEDSADEQPSDIQSSAQESLEKTSTPDSDEIVESKASDAEIPMDVECSDS